MSFLSVRLNLLNDMIIEEYILFVKLLGILKLYSLSGDEFKKFTPLSKLIKLTVTPVSCIDWKQCAKIIG